MSSASPDMARPYAAGPPHTPWASLRRVVENVSWLSLNHALSYILPLVTTPILTRGFGAQAYGVYSTALAYGAYAALFVTYGFNYYGPRAVALSRDDPAELSRIYSAILTVQALIGLAVLGALAAAVAIGGFADGGLAVYVALAAQAAITAATPLWLFLGLQSLRKVSLVQCVGRLALVAVTVAIVRRPTDLLPLAIAMLAIAGAVLLITLREARRTVGWLHRPRKDAVRRVIAEAAPFFWSSVAVSAYASSSIVVVSAMLGPSAAGHFALAEKLRLAAVSLTVPLTQAVYPFFNQQAGATAQAGNDLPVRRLFVATMLVYGVAASLAMGLFAPEIIRLLGGRDFGGAVLLLQIMAPAPLLIGVSNILGRQTLIPWGHIRLFTRLTFAAAIIGMVAIVALVYLLGVTGAAWSGLLVETFVAVAMAVAAARKGLLRRAFALT